MWRLLLLGVVAVAADDRWSRQSTDRRQGDWIPVAAPSSGVSFHKGRSVDQNTAASSGLASVLTPPIQQQHPRLLAPPPPDGLFQHSATSGLFNTFPGQQSLIDTKPRQFLPQQNLNNQPPTFRFKDNPQLSDSAGIPSNLFQVGPQQFTQNPSQQTSQLVSSPPFLSPQFLPPPQRSPLQSFVPPFNSPPLLSNIQFPEFQLQADQPFLSGSLPPQPVIFNQLAPPLSQPPGRFTSNITNDFKQETQNQGKEEVQLLYVPVETLRQRGRTFPPTRGNKKVEPSNLNQNSFNLNQPPLPSTPHQTTKPFFRQNNEENEQYFRQSQINPQLQNINQQLHNVIQETTAPQYKQTLPPHLLQEHTTYKQDIIQNQQSAETVTPLPTNTNVNKYRLEQQRNDFPRPSDQQYTFEQFQRPQESVTPGKLLENSNQNYYHSQQVNSDSFNRNNNQQSFQQTSSPVDLQTTVPPPHQPPLSVYMETTANSKVADVLTHLKNAKTIPVLDSIGPDSPQVFVGPSNLNPPNGYLKFELPYLSSIDNNRVERKVDKLPFFVAPLNFQPPPGYSKIPFPAPHIGSVVVSNITILKSALHEKPGEYLIRPESSTPSDISQFSVTADLQSFSPPLPSLVNSLQDERYFPVTTTEPLTTTPAQTTPVYTTPYRRNPSRGTHKVYTTTTEDVPTRRPVTRQRRPHTGRPNTYRASQIVTTTTPEPIVATKSQQYDQSNEQQNIYGDIITTETPNLAFSNQNTREPVYDNTDQERSQYHSQNKNQHNFNQLPNNERYNQNYPQNFNTVVQPQNVVPQLEQVQNYFTQLQQQYAQGNQDSQKQNSPITSQHIQQNSDNFNLEGNTQNPLESEYNNYSPNVFDSDLPQQQTTEAVLQRVSSQSTESNTPSNNTPSNGRRDPLRQRFRGRHPHQTTTEYLTTTEQVYAPQRIKTRPSNAQTHHVIKENSYHHENYPTNTERLDDQSTERNEEISFNNEFRVTNVQNQQPIYQSRPEVDSDKEQFYHQQHYNVKHIPQSKPNDERENQYSSEERLEYHNTPAAPQVENSTPYFSEPRETTQIPNVNVHNVQQTYTADTSSKYEEKEQTTDRPAVNQQRINKYTTRVRGRLSQGQQTNDESYQQHNAQDVALRQQNNYQEASPAVDSAEISKVTESEVLEQTTTPKPTVVRVRGRVRNRQRTSSARQTTTTEPPNYPVESGLVTNSDTQYTRRPAVHRRPHGDRTSNYNRYSSNRHRNPNAQSHYNDNENTDNEFNNNQASTKSATEESGSTTTDSVPVSRKYNHILNRNIARRPNTSRQSHHSSTTVTTETAPVSDSGTTTKYLVRTTRKPVTQVTKLGDGRARIRRPTKSAVPSSTTEYPPSSNGEEGFAPSAASNEVLDPYYPSAQTNYNNHNVNHNLHYNSPNRNPTKSHTPAYESSTILTPTPFQPANNDGNAEDYWNQGFTIQQSNSYDFSAESSPVTQSTLSSNRYTHNEDGFSEDDDNNDEDDRYQSHKSTAAWNNPSRQTSYTQDQTPYSSNEQYVAASRNSKTKSKQSSQYNSPGKENQWNEKTKEEEEQTDEQYDSETNANKNDESDGQFKASEASSDELPKEEIRPVYVENTPESENEKHVSSPNDAHLAFSAPEDIIRTKEGFIQRKPVDPVTGKKSGRRRGAWVRVRVHKKNKDVFETAESQNLASLSNNNAIKSSENKNPESDVIIREYSIPPNHRPTDPYSTVAPQTTVSQTTTEQIVTTTEANESFQKSLTDMIREIIQEEEKEEERLNENDWNKTVATTVAPFVPDQVTENQHLATTTIISEAVTTIPEATTQPILVDVEGSTTIKPDIQQEENTTIESRVLGTSTTTEISLETEICYRGRCVKSKKNKKPLKYNPSASDLESDLMVVE